MHLPDDVAGAVEYGEIYIDGDRLLHAGDGFRVWHLRDEEWIEELIVRFELEGFLYSRFKIEYIKKIGSVYRLTARILGEKFDPNLHQALMATDSDEESNTILEEFQSGYTIGDRIIRPAKVKVSK